MSLILNNHISVSDFNALKKKISDECNRRQYSNKLKKITLRDKNNGDIINDIDFKAILEPLTVLDAFPGSLDDIYIYTNIAERTVTLADINQEPIKPIEILNSIMDTVSNWTDPHKNNSTSSDCRGSCAGLCQGCTGTCDTTCTGSCSGTCKGGCGDGCSSCTGGCSGCSGGCSSCTGTCKGSCAYICHNNCGYGCMDTGGNDAGARCTSGG